MNYILLSVSIIINTVNNILRSFFSKNDSLTEADLQLYNVMASIASALTLTVAALVKGGGGLSLYTVGMSLLYGVVIALATVFMLKALGMGPVSYSNLIINGSLIIPALSGWLLYGEPIGLTKMVGIVLMMVCIVLSVDRKGDDQQRKATLRWLLYALLSGLFVGLVGVLQKIHQSSPHGGELSWFLVIAFAFSAVYSLLMLLNEKRKGTPMTVTVSAKSAVVYMAAVCGITFGAANLINMYLSGVMSSIVFFPTVNGGCLLLMLVASVVIFREKLTKLQWLGVVIGCVSIGLLCF